MITKQYVPANRYSVEDLVETWTSAWREHVICAGVFEDIIDLICNTYYLLYESFESAKTQFASGVRCGYD